MKNVIDLQRVKRFAYALGLLGALFAGSSSASAQEACEPPESFKWCDTTNESSLQGCCDDWSACDAQAYINNGGSDDGPWHCAIGTAVQCGRGEYGLCYTY